ncbi:hypothetical protein vseg_013074 [Gypsophila vaccaria]
MASLSHHHHTRKKRKRSKSKIKFDVGDTVEVRSDEDGFIGSWHPAKIISWKIGCRVVKYDHLLSDDDKMYTESIEVAGVIDGITNESPVNRGRIRPRPLAAKLKGAELHYGLCVDSYLNDAWWEGVVFDDNDGSRSREIFFPDLGDVAKVELENMRITWDWNEVTEEWTPRGKWLFLEIIRKYELENVIPVSVRQIWYDMRVKKEFGELGDWCYPENIPLWEPVIMKVIDEYLMLTAEQFLSGFDFLEAKFAEANSFAAHDVVPRINDDLQKEEIAGSEPLALTIVPAGSILNHVVEPEFGGISNRKIQHGHRKSKNKWKPYNIDPEFCPECVDDYDNTGKPGTSLTTKFRQHVVSLRWTLESTVYGAQQRMRYISPEGRVFYSPREAVAWLKSERDNSPKMADGSHILTVTSLISPKSVAEKSSHVADDDQNAVIKSPCNLNVTALPDISIKRKRKRDDERYDRIHVPSKYCPELVFEYLESFVDVGARSAINSSVTTNNARMHLSAIGWKLSSRKREGGKDVWRYDSPTSKEAYFSIKKAFQAIKDGKEFNTRHPSSEGSEDLIGDQQTVSESSHALWKHRGAEIRKYKRKKNSRQLSLPSYKHERGDAEVADTKVTDVSNNKGRLLISSFMSKKRKALNKMKSYSEGHNSTRVLRSSKRVRQTGPPSSSQLPRTILSWLVDNNAVVPRSKVFYYEEDSAEPLAEGRIASDGITCSCCKKLFTLTGFQAHVAGHSSRCPVENIFLEDGKSLLSCQVEMMHRKVKNLCREPVERAKGPRSKAWNDHVCSICHYGGKLMLCDQCPSSYHNKCLNLQGIPEGDWFCPSCCCGVCGKRQFDMNTEQFTDDSILFCHQCERRYHAGCKKNRDVNPGENWFCCRTCEKTHWGLQQLLGKPILVGQDNLTWTLIKPMQYELDDHEDCDLVAMAENFSKISVALEVMHECFEPVKEPRTRRDLVEDVLFCRPSNLNRLNFKGFYTVLLERNDELITVALLRVYGDKVAEIPLIGTRFPHRRLGMCRVLMNEVEKNLLNLGVHKLVLPAAASVLNTWITSFGFSRVEESDRSEFIGYTFLDFQDTTMCQKVLRKLPPLPNLSRDMSGVVCNRPRRTIEGSSSVLDHEGNSSMSEVFQEDQREGSETVDQGTQINGSEDKPNGANNHPDVPPAVMTATVASNQEGEQPCTSSDFVVRIKSERDKSEGNLQFYRRKKAVEPRPPAPQSSYSNVQVSCR